MRNKGVKKEVTITKEKPLKVKGSFLDIIKASAKDANNKPPKSSKPGKS